MNRRTARLAYACLLLTLLAPLAIVRPARGDTFRPDTLADSTWVARWKLSNGLDVTVRNVRGASSVASLLVFRIGRDLDPKGREGLADLACEVLFSGATADAPERSRREMDSIRPLGWNLQVTPRFSLIGEVAKPSQFPGMLRGLASRLRAVTVTDSLMASCRRTVNAEQAEKYLLSPDLTLYNRIRDVALGIDDATLLRRVTGRNVEKMTAAEMSDRLRTLYVPANAALAITGDFESVDLAGLVHNLFEGIPGGTPVVEPPLPKLVASGRLVQRDGLRRPLGVAGVIAPAITDSLSPDFYFNAILMGKFCEDQWGPGRDGVNVRFKYSIFADPQIVSFFPPILPGETDPDAAGIALQDALEKLGGTIVQPSSYRELRLNHQWIFGGAMSPSLTQRCREHPGTLFTLANTMGVRALWGDEAFWVRYRARFMSETMTGGGTWLGYFEHPNNIVRLLLVPARR